MRDGIIVEKGYINVHLKLLFLLRHRQERMYLFILPATDFAVTIVSIFTGGGFTGALQEDTVNPPVSEFAGRRLDVTVNPPPSVAPNVSVELSAILDILQVKIIICYCLLYHL